MFNYGPIFKIYPTFFRTFRMQWDDRICFFKIGHYEKGVFERLCRSSHVTVDH